MGNLPRSRPGRRSDKRAAGGPKGGARKGAGKPRTKPAAAKATAKPRAKPATARKRTTAPASGGKRAPRTAVRDERTEAPIGQDPITAALRVGVAVGDAGLKAVAKLVGRLPRP
jgi:hypothetical protein